MRWGELAGLRRRHLDLDARTVRVRETVSDVGGLYKGKPKSKAGYRTVSLPELIVPDLRRHLDEFAAPGPNGFVFVGVRGNQLRRGNFSKYWADACAAVGLEDVHLHDLRHTGNTYAAEAGASVRELMRRMGHSSTRAAMIYLHARRAGAGDRGPVGGEGCRGAKGQRDGRVQARGRGRGRRRRSAVRGCLRPPPARRPAQIRESPGRVAAPHSVAPGSPALHRPPSTLRVHDLCRFGAP
ncbi:tyrosine-type recombinase/integrase [Nocardiopsis eucommiae]|uniref:tyrosine-type recombinase/integrase n=1 Tax=Nocardiopsis eucommiae TaxID=2831970 RepID=UPI003D73F585